VQNSIIETEFVAEAAGTAGAFAAQMAAARLAPGWETLVASVKAIAISEFWVFYSDTHNLPR